MSYDPIEIAKQMLRTLSYRRAHAYRVVFGEPGKRTREQEVVLADLRDFTFAQKSTFSSDQQISTERQGRRRVWLRIADHLQLGEDETHGMKALEIDDGL